MSYQLPDGKALSFDWSLQPAYSAPQAGEVDFHWASGLTAESRWSGSNYDVLVAWGAVDEATSYQLTLQHEGGIVGEVTTNVLSHAFRGILPKTSLTIVLTPLAGDREMMTITAEVETGAGLPGAMDGVDYTFTETSLTPEWTAVEDADGYVVALFHDEVELDRADVTGTSATFEGLEDGTRYTLSFYAYNAQGLGPETTGYDATTAYKIPSPPSNIRQDGEMIIGISTLWDAPVKINQLHIQLFYGDQVLYDEYAPGTQTARVFPVPMASTNYLLRIRAGNPAGWSEWAETVVYTEKYPLIDSRLGVMATTYQEDALYLDTWDNGSEKPTAPFEDLESPFRIEGMTVELRETLKLPVEHIQRDQAGIGSAVSIFAAQRALQLADEAGDKGGLGSSASLSAVQRPLKVDAAASDAGGLGAAVSAFGYSVRLQYSHSAYDPGGMVANPTITVRDETA